MKPKQLANVLIKILGLSVCAHSIVPLLNGLFGVLSAAQNYGSSYRSGFWFYLINGVIPAVIGIFLIVQSRLLTEKLFKDEAE
jgi:hypothetical protein